MKLVIAFLSGEDAGRVLNKLQQADIPATMLESRGGFLRRSNTTMLTAVEEDRVDRVLKILRDACKPRTERVDTTFTDGAVESLGLPPVTEVPVGGATVLVLDVEQVVRI